MNFEFIDLSLDDRQFKGETHNKNLEDAMKQAIVNFCKSMDTGLFLLDMPTGFGKTYSVLDFMVDNYDAPEFKDKKIFFVTTLKKNLPDKELREHFARRGKADDYDKYCLRIEANADMVVQKLDELYRARKIPPTITMKQEFKDLHGSVKLLNEYRDKKRELKGNSKDIINVLCKSAEDAIRKQQEGAFRKVIESELKQFRTPKEKLKNIANNPDYHWIGELYPAVYTREKRIFFMSMDKFFLGNTTIIEPTYSFYNNDITKNAIIFIDEFDATRDRLLNQIITRGLENHIDYLGLFHRVYASLKTRDFPAELTTASKLQQAYLDEHKNAKNPMEIIEGFGGVFDETYDRFAMQYSFKTEEDGKGDRSRNFIFNDLQFHSVFEGENAFIDIDTDMKAKQNWLCFTKRRPAEKDGGVLSLLASVKGCLTYFQNGARNLSFNYKHHKDEDKRPGDDDYTFENAIESVLTEFHLSREQIRYLKPIVMGGQVKSKKDKKDSNGKMSLKYFDRSVYNRGFRYYDFIDDPNHSMRSEIQLFDFQDSPERILLHLSEKAQIIGISATATLDTVIGNYDLEYLQRMLQDKFYVMPEVDKCRLQESFRTFVANYDKVNIHVEPVCYSTDDTAELAEIFNGNEEAKCSVGKRLSKKKLNVRYIHDKSFYSDSEVDPHQESMEDYVVQHITVENFKHQSSAAVYNILKELVIKKDIATGKITLVDWSQYGYKADWLFGVVVDGTYYFMTIHPDGSFKIEALKRNLFTMTEYDKYMDYFGLNEENKNDYRGVIGLVKDAEGNINLIKDTNMYSMPDYTAMGDVLKNVASEGRFPGKDVVTWLRLVMDTTDKIKVHAELDIVIPHIDVNAEYTKANVMGLFKGITTKKEVVRYVFENTGIMLYAYLRGEEERREYLSGNIDINYFDYDDTHAKYSVGEIGNGMKYTIERASVVREIQAVEGSKLIFKKVLPLMGVEFVRYGMLTVVPFPFKYLREYIVKEDLCD